MKKKIIILSSALTAILSATTVFAGGPEIIPVIPDYFTGFFVGGTGSVHFATFDADASTEIDPFGFSGTATIAGGAAGVLTSSVGPVATSNEPDGSSWDGFGGVQGGLGITVWHQYYLGVAGFGEWGKQTHSSSTSVNLPATLASNVVITGNDGVETFIDFSNTTAQNSDATLTTTTKVELSNDYGVYFKPGYLLTPTIMVYGKLGAIWATEKVTNNVQYSLNQTGSNNVQIGTGPTTPPLPVAVNETVSAGAAGSSDSGNKTKVAFLLGGGLESFIFPSYFGNHVTLSADYSWANFGHVTTTTSVVGAATASGTFAVDDLAPADFNVSAPITGQTSATAAATINIFQGAVNFYFGNTIL